MDGIVYTDRQPKPLASTPSKAFLLFPTDLWFEVIEYLLVTDVIRLRAVSRNFYRIVSSPVVWKRLLRKMRIQLPWQPLPISSLTAKATENVIRRALCLDVNWQRIGSRTGMLSTSLPSVERPYMVRILPGGKWLVAATKSSEDESYAVVVWDLENPQDRGGGCALLAKCRTRTIISHLVVRYMHHEGKQGIAIGTLRLIGEKPATKMEVCVLHISLDNLERLSKNQPPEGLPFKLIELHKSRCQIAYMSIEGKILTVVHRPRTLMFMDLETKKSAQLKLYVPQDGRRHSIQGCKILPFQNQVFVIRLIYAEDHTSYAFEMHEFPPWDTTVKEPAPIQHQVFEEVAASSFVMSDLVVRQASADRPSVKEMEESCHYASPISIFAHTVRPKGIIHWQLVPQLKTTNTPPRNFSAMMDVSITPNLIGHNPAFPAPSNPYPPNGPFIHPGFAAGAPIPPQFPGSVNPGAQGNGVSALANATFPNTHGVPTQFASVSRVSSELGKDGPTAMLPQYSLPATRLAHYWFEEGDQKPTVLPGADRSVFWTRPHETRADSPPMRNLLAYMTRVPRQRHFDKSCGETELDAAFLDSYDPTVNDDSYIDLMTAADDPSSSQDDRRLKQLRLIQDFIEAVQLGTPNAAFDESSGKLCIVAGKPTKLLLLDYAV